MLSCIALYCIVLYQIMLYLFYLIVFYLNYFFYYILGPHGPPTNVTANVTSSRSFNIKMCLPTLDDANGIITQYTVFFKLVEYKDTREENVTRKLLPNATNEHCTEADFDGLRTFSEYDVQVAAWTIIGMGPRSISMFFKTFEDGNDL